MSGTGIVRDDLFIQHNMGSWHPESPERLKSIYRMIDFGRHPNLVTLEQRMASREEITLVHRPHHFDKIAQTEGQPHTVLDADTSTCGESHPAALAAAGGLISLTEKVLAGELENGFALVRPPGHHAEAGRAMGFCLFNNVAVAAANAVQVKGLNRVMIVDWDLHHGNGTQHSFYDDPRVLYISTHQYPHYPGTGNLGEQGRGQGLGYNINVPLAWGHNDSDFISIFQKIVLPVGRMFRPELILVSAGFDIHKNDPLGDMLVSNQGFGAMARLLKDLAKEVCGGRLVFTLEGGYFVEGQTEGVANVLDVLTGIDNISRDLAYQDLPEPEIVQKVRRMFANFWLL
ncbi:MAG: histone deacetylase [Pseudomonadota bacterium]